MSTTVASLAVPPARAGGKPARWGTAGLFLATLLLTRHTQIPGLTGIVAPFTLLLLALGLQVGKRLPLAAPFGLIATASMLWSLYAGVPGGNVWRFYVICIATLLAFCFKPVSIRRWLVLSPVFLQAVAIICISAYLAVMHDQVLASVVRNYVLDQAWGDIYSFDGYYYRVQLNGNALLPLLWMMTLFTPGRSRLSKGCALAVSGLSLIVAGNLTYLASASVAVLIWLRRETRGKLVASLSLGVVVAVIVVTALGSIQEVLDRKFAGSNSSMATRFDQIQVATDAISLHPERLVVGFGLGAPFPDGRMRDYSHQNYIELQSLYLAYQLGIVGSLAYLMCLLALSRSALSADGLLIFWLFILSGLSNPYILDSNQIIATVLLVCLFPKRRVLR